MSIPVGSLELVVAQDAIDVNGHVNNVQYVQWMQDAARHHSAGLGWHYERYVRLGATWIIRSHNIEYLHSSYLGDRLTVYTWVAHIKKFRSQRKFLFYRAEDATVVARASTVFIFCDIAGGGPRSIPQEVQLSYLAMGDDFDPLQ